MRITQVSFRSNIQIRAYHHISIEMTATLTGDEPVSTALETLKNLVAVELRKAKHGEPKPYHVRPFAEMLDDKY